MNQKHTKRLTYISLFSGAGVGCYAFKKNNFDCIATVEIVERRIKVQKYNNKCKYGSGYISDNISISETQNRIYNEIDLWKNRENLKEVDVVIATPPCQGMSVANHKKNNEIHRNSLVLDSINLINKIQPRFFIFENVKAFLSTLCNNGDGKEITINQAIELHLAGRYNILKKVINFKDYGSQSSRTRTLVVGVRKDIKDVSPYDLFPTKENPKNLKEVIGKYPPLIEMGNILDSDIYHNFKEYDARMLPWVENTKEGCSAFDNQNILHRPHKIVDSKIIPNQNKNGDKYRRCSWNIVAPCIHTRNDILASQSTIHPIDNRVFSIRELMDLMTIPKDFQWTDKSFEQLNILSIKDKKQFLKKEEINIRQSIGEAVPTRIFEKIAYNIQKFENETKTDKQIKEIIVNNSLLQNFDNLKSFIEKNIDHYSLVDISKIIELSNINRNNFAAFYTPQSICYSVIDEIPCFEKKKEIHILEPSVGIGNFIGLLSSKFENHKIFIDVVDIDSNIISLLKIIITKINNPNLFINFINADFLNYKFSKKYDLIIGNPPFGKTEDKDIFKNVNFPVYNKKTKNLFSLFIEKSLTLASYVALITPKTLLSSPEYNLTKKLLEENTKITTIIDYGEKGFKNVKIETISLIIDNRQNILSKKQIEYPIKVISYINNNVEHICNIDIFDNDFNLWLIYKNDFFKEIKQKMFFSVYNFYRDREITKKNTSSQGRYRLLKSRNIGNNSIVDIQNYDSYIDNIENLSVRKFLNSKCILVPNLSYSPRACLLPPNTLVDGSVALLQPKNGFLITEKDLTYYNTEEFRKFYMIGRNYSSRSLNIDANSVNLLGLKKELHLQEHKS